jgi:diketogulonate reductase-like aldo/keto reductase
VIAACRKHNVSFTSYSPLGQGGRLLSEPAIVEIAKRHRKTPAQIVLRWHVQQDGVVAIPKSADPRRIAENIAIFDFSLAAEEMRALSGLASASGRLISPAWSPKWDR